VLGYNAAGPPGGPGGGGHGAGGFCNQERGGGGGRFKLPQPRPTQTRPVWARFKLFQCAIQERS